MQFNAAADTARRQFGWTDDKHQAFVLGDNKIGIDTPNFPGASPDMKYSEWGAKQLKLSFNQKKTNLEFNLDAQIYSGIDDVKTHIIKQLTKDTNHNDVHNLLRERENKAIFKQLEIRAEAEQTKKRQIRKEQLNKELSDIEAYMNGRNKTPQVVREALDKTTGQQLAEKLMKIKEEIKGL
jgi:hypothetical protein